jgi:hypothetical protein
MLKLIVGILFMLGGLFFGFVSYMMAGGEEGWRNFDRSRLLRGDELTTSMAAVGLLFLATILLATRMMKKTET